LRPDGGGPSAESVRNAERLVAMEGKLPAFRKGEYQPKDNEERLGLAGVCHVKKLYLAAARLYADAYAEGPKLAGGIRPGNRYDAARAAARAGCGQGDDAPASETERARWRGQALDWLREHLAFTAKHLATGTPRARADVQGWLRGWRTDAHLAGLREAAALAKLPANEQAAWRKLWADVEALRAKARDTK
jgi:serine/threonine-protein kinase